MDINLVREDFERGLKYINKSRPDKALQIFKRIERQGAHFKEVFLNLGTCYKQLDNDTKAYEYYNLANSDRVPLTTGSFGPLPQALYNLGLLAGSLKHDDKTAEKFFRKAIDVAPTYVQPKWGLANCLLKQYFSNKIPLSDEAWTLYETRFKTEDKPTKLKVDKEIRLWNGYDRVDELLVLTEQGFGDFIMFGRYIPYLKHFANKVIVQCHDKLKPLFKDYTVVDHVSETNAQFGVPVCSLAGIFNGKIPPAEWLAHLHKPENTTNIGVVWGGSATHANNKYRVANAQMFKRLEKFGKLFTINPLEHGTKGFEALRGETFYDTAMNYNKLDLIISVDTSPVHLAGAMGKECWVLLGNKATDWRWGDNSMGYKTMWYDSVRVFRNNGSWDATFDVVEKELAARVSSKQT